MRPRVKPQQNLSLGVAAKTLGYPNSPLVSPQTPGVAAVRLWDLIILTLPMPSQSAVLLLPGFANPAQCGVSDHGAIRAQWTGVRQPASGILG